MHHFYSSLCRFFVKVFLPVFFVVQITFAETNPREISQIAPSEPVSKDTKEVLPLEPVLKISNKAAPTKPDIKIKKQFALPDNILILEFFLKDIFLDEAFIAYEKGGKTFIPLDTLFKKLNFPIAVNSFTGVARGWFIEKSRNFDLDLTNAKVNVFSEDKEFKDKDIIWTEDEVLVSTRLLENWLPFKFFYNSLNQAITLQSLVTIPLEERIARGEKQQELKDRKITQKNDIPYIQSEYSLFSIPNTNLRLQGTLSDRSERNNITLSTLSKGDLLYSTLNLFTSSNESSGLQTFRMSLGRKDQKADLFGFFNATEYETGDVFTPATDMINNSNYGFGFRLNNYPSTSSRNIGTLPINGILEPNWEVELYRDSLLIDFTTTNVDGSYEFQDAPLNSGQNNFILKFYGPTGEKREKIIRYYYSSELAPTNRLFYRLSVNQHRRNIYNSGYALEKLDEDPSDGKTHKLFDLEYGIINNLTFKLGRIEVPMISTGILENYNRVGLKTSFLGIYTVLDHVEQEDTGGTANQLSYVTNLGKYNILGKFQSYEGAYNSHIRPFSTNPIKSAYEFRLTGNLAFSKKRTAVYSLTMLKKNYAIEGFTDNSIFNFTMPYDSSSFSNRFSQQNTQNIGGSNISNSNGIFSYRHNINRTLSVRSDFGYDVSPSFQTDSLSFRSSYRINEKASMDGRLFYYFEKNSTSGTKRAQSSQYTFQYSRKMKGMNFGLVFSKQNEISQISLNVTSNFGHDSVQGDWITTPISLTEKGFVTIRAFFDENHNGFFDSDDIPLENMRIKLNRKYANESTNKDGLLTIENVPAYSINTIEFDEGSLNNPYWNAKNKTQSVKLHPGSTVYLDFVIQKTGEIEGLVSEIVKGKIENIGSIMDNVNIENMVSTIENDETKGIGGVEIELYNTQGQLIKKTKSFFDGFFLFDRVPAGDYQVKISKHQLDKHGYRVLKKHSDRVHLEADEIEVVNLNIIKK